MEREASSNKTNQARKLDAHIVEAFKKFGFEEGEIFNGCWCLERKGKKIAWIALHKFLERVAQTANITFDEPKVLNCTEKEVAIYVNGQVRDLSAWSIGEASTTNCTNEYRWAMAEKRAKDRVILKLLGVAGDMYSEEEADEFKKQNTEEIEDFKKQAKKEQTAYTKALKAGEQLPLEMSKEEAIGRYPSCLAFVKSDDFKKSVNEQKKSHIDSVNRYILTLKKYGLNDKANEISKKLREATIDDEIVF